MPQFPIVMLFRTQINIFLLPERFLSLHLNSW